MQTATDAVAPLATLARMVKNDLGVQEAYQHAPKWITPGQPINTLDAVLKRYDLAPHDKPVPGEIERLAREYLAHTPLEARGLGFVILHGCGSDFYFLIVNTWRGNNELWETVFYKDGAAMADFAPFPREGMHKPTFCVWELAPVWYEKEAWERFLSSVRDETAAQEWLDARHAGVA
jgi:hypothetical protein